MFDHARHATFVHVASHLSYVVVDERFLRPAEVNILLGDPAKAREKLGWELEISFEEMVRLMVDRDLELVAKQSE